MSRLIAFVLEFHLTYVSFVFVSDTVVLVVLLAAAEISDPTAAALERAARDVLGSEATIRLVSDPSPLSDEATLARAGPADGVVELSWNDEHRTAKIHCYLAREARWLDRTITFDRKDADAERGRLPGFAIGSMLAQESRSSAGVENVAPPPPPKTRVEIDVAPKPEAVPMPPARWL